MTSSFGAARGRVQPLRLFISYAHEDEHLVNRLNVLLAPLRQARLLQTWHDRAISPGVKWEERILSELNAADIVLLIITPDFLNSMYSIQTELKLSLERQKSNLVRIIPVIGKRCFWKDFSDLSSFQVLPKDGKPIEIDGKIKELRLVDAAKGIIQAVEELVAAKLDVPADPQRSSENPNPESDAKVKAPENSTPGADKTSAKTEFSRRFRFWLITSAALAVTFAVIGGMTWNYRAAAKGGSPGEPVAELLEMGKDLYKQRKYSAALPFLRQAEEKGSGEADDYIGLLYRDGKSVPKDYKAAEKWFLRAASRRNSDGMNHLGLLHESGSGIPLSYENALNWFRKAEALGNGDAMNNLGWMFLSGWGVPKDANKALEYFQKAATHSCGDGMNNLGWLYQEGIAVPKQDYDQAFKWFKKGADHDSSLAMNSIGWMFLNGWGRPKDQRKAIQWFEIAANRDDNLGSGMAMNNLGLAYEKGLGVAQDKTKAISWYQKASEVGNHLAKLNLGRLGGGPECVDHQKPCNLVSRSSVVKEFYSDSGPVPAFWHYPRTKLWSVATSVGLGQFSRTWGGSREQADVQEYGSPS